MCFNFRLISAHFDAEFQLRAKEGGDALDLYLFRGICIQNIGHNLQLIFGSNLYIHIPRSRYVAAAECDPADRPAREAAGSALHGAKPKRSAEAVGHFEAALGMLLNDSKAGSDQRKYTGKHV